MSSAGNDVTPDEGYRDLTISGGGSTMVATDTVFAEMATLRRVQGDAEDWEVRIGRVQSLGLGSSLQWRPSDLGACVLGAWVAIHGVAGESRQLADSLAEAAEQYGRLEAGLDTLLSGMGAWLGYTAGQLAMFAPLIAVSLAGPLAYAAVGSLTWNALQGRPGEVLPPGVADWLRDNPRLLSDPATVRLVRVLVSSADEVALGRVGVPYPVAAALGDDGAGVLGAASSAFGLLVAARAAGLLRETPVRVRLAGSSPAPVAAPAAGGVQSGPGGESTATLAAPKPPTGFADLADRIPTEEDGAQVRIERYGDAEHPRWVVYIGGTVEWAPAASTEPWDMTSNVAAVADQEAGSYRAVLQALHAAGVQPGDPVVPVAHSQGGLIANQLVSRGDITAVGMVTFGAPETGLALPDGLPAIAIEHEEDIVPALGGTSEEDQRLYVRRELFAGRDVPLDETLPAHQLVGYRDTAGIVDASPEPRLAEFRAQLGEIVGKAPGEQSLWHAERVD
ncbi:hypothetical protein BJQ94_19225 [Cryobacterium sp. SO2]|uniref:hypothetical protein n=1 Tax=Cryobacterium sp. SO2 TaxID=1897060 RepID=UPI00223DEE82|nr:hypothetical protein [Cryobacterium sp. SO2]WEO77454.1 hypothetical protein BJQ94_19225 [Cryobacterium sp. SO2]